MYKRQLIGCHHVTADTAKRCCVTDNGFAERISFKDQLGYCVMCQVVRLILNHLHFLKDNGTFFGHLVFIEYRIIQHIENDLRALFEIRADGFDIIAGCFLAGERVDLSSDAVDFLRNLPRISFFGSLKHHMFDKMGYAGILFVFIAGSSFYPYAEGRGLHIIYFFHNDAHTARQGSDIDFAHFCLFLLPCPDQSDN